MLRRQRALPAGSLSIHPYWLGRGLVSALAFGNGNIIDLTGKNPQTVAYAGTQGYNAAGRGLYLSGAGGAGIPNAALSSGQTVTRIAVLSLGATGGGTIAADANGGGSGRLQWRISSTSLSVVKSGIVELASWPISAAVGEATAVGFTYDNGALRGYQGGKQVGSATSAQTFSAYLTAALGQNYNGENFNGIINLHLDFNQVLSDAEMRLITQHPAVLVDSTMTSNPYILGAAAWTVLASNAQLSADIIESAAASDASSTSGTVAASVTESANATDEIGDGARAAKLVGYAITGGAPDKATASKISGYVVTGGLPGAITTSKMLAYAVTDSFQLGVAEPAAADSTQASARQTPASQVEAASAAESASVGVSALVAASFAETANAGDLPDATASGTFADGVIETAAASEAGLARIATMASQAESASAADAQTTDLTQSGTVTEAATAADGQAVLVKYRATFIATAVADDSVGSAAAVGVAVAEQLDAQDAANAGRTTQASQADAATADDVSSNGTTIRLRVVEAATATDASIGGKVALAAIAETPVVKIKGKNTGGASDAVNATARATVRVAIVESAAAGDSQQRGAYLAAASGIEAGAAADQYASSYIGNVDVSNEAVAATDATEARLDYVDAVAEAAIAEDLSSGGAVLAADQVEAVAAGEYSDARVDFAVMHFEAVAADDLGALSMQTAADQLDIASARDAVRFIEGETIYADMLEAADAIDAATGLRIVNADIAEPTDFLTEAIDVIDAESHPYIGDLVGRLSLRPAVSGEVATRTALQGKQGMGAALRGINRIRSGSNQ